MSEAHKRGDGLLHYGQTVLLLAMHLILIMSGLSHASDFQASRSSLWAYSGRVQHNDKGLALWYDIPKPIVCFTWVCGYSSLPYHHITLTGRLLKFTSPCLLKPRTSFHLVDRSVS